MGTVQKYEIMKMLSYRVRRAVQGQEPIEIYPEIKQSRAFGKLIDWVYKLKNRRQKSEELVLGPGSECIQIWSKWENFVRLEGTVGLARNMVTKFIRNDVGDELAHLERKPLAMVNEYIEFCIYGLQWGTFSNGEAMTLLNIKRPSQILAKWIPIYDHWRKYWNKSLNISPKLRNVPLA